MVFSGNGPEAIRMLLVKFQRLVRGSMRRKVFMGFWVVVITTVIILAYRHKTSRDHHLLVTRTKNHFERYCNRPGNISGYEHIQPPEYTSLVLKQVHVMVRHGDRSSVIDDLPSTITPHHFKCRLSSRHVEHAQKLRNLKEMQTVFKRNSKKKGKMTIIEDFVFLEAVPCKLGQLTPQGYMQHFLLGEHMYKAYRKKLGLTFAVLEEQQIAAFTTPVERTQQSAAAFLSGMFYPVFKKANSLESFPTIHLHVSSDPLGFMRDEENGEVMPCTRSLREAIRRGKETVAYKHGLSSVQPLLDRYSWLFQLPRQQLPPITHLTDLVLTHYCHDHPPLCGPNGCMDKRMQAESLAAGNWAFTTNYTPIAEIATHSILTKIVRKMLLSTVGQEYSRFMLYSTHDSTLIPVLVQLGIFPKEWIRYSSRIVFELWEAEGVLAMKLKGLEKFFVRILYNGQDLTRQVSFCKHSLKFGKLCPLSSFKASLEAGAESMEERYLNLCKSIP